MKKDVRMLNTSLKSTETGMSFQSEIKVMSRCLSAPDATSLHHCPQEQAAKTSMLSVVRIKYLVLCIVEEGVAKLAYD